jgi:hypothetical protein
MAMDIEKNTDALLSLKKLEYLYCNIGMLSGLAKGTIESHFLLRFADFDYRKLMHLKLICSCHLPQEPPRDYFKLDAQAIFLVPRRCPTTYLSTHINNSVHIIEIYIKFVASAYVALFFMRQRPWIELLNTSPIELRSQLLNTRNYPNDEILLDMVLSGTKIERQAIRDQIQVLLNLGADPTAASQITGWNSFHTALMQNYTPPESLDLLLAAAVKRCGSENEAGRLLARSILSFWSPEVFNLRLLFLYS